MLKEHKVARQYLKDCSLSEYNRIVTEAKLTPMDRKMLDEYIIITKRCNRCLKPMRNDGTEQNPHWVCNNPKCVKYVPPEPEPEQEQTDETAE